MAGRNDGVARVLRIGGCLHWLEAQLRSRQAPCGSNIRQPSAQAGAAKHLGGHCGGVSDLINSSLWSQGNALRWQCLSRCLVPSQERIQIMQSLASTAPVVAHSEDAYAAATPLPLQQHAAQTFPYASAPPLES